MTSVGIDQNTGKVLVGWSHVAQSLTKLVTTELGSRIERRDLGSFFPNLIDRPQNEETILRFFLSIAEAIEPRRVRTSIYGEPRFNLTAVSVRANTPGEIAVALEGDYFPDGHKTEPAPAQRRRLVINIPASNLE